MAKEKKSKSGLLSKLSKLNRLREKITQVKKFLDKVTSTVAGTRKLYKKLKKKFGYEDMSDKQFKDVWDTVTEAEELSGEKWSYVERRTAEAFYIEHEGRVTPAELADYIKGTYGGAELRKLKERETTEENFRKKFDNIDFLE